MARPKKEDIVSKKSKKKIVEESDEEVEDVVVKKSKKVPKPKSKKQVEETDELDELSELDVDEENNDEVVSTSESQAKKNVDKKPINTNTYQQPQSNSYNNNNNNNNGQRRQFEPRERKVINPQTPICELKIDEIFTYLIQYGKDNCNPSLIEMMSQNLRDITGRGRSYNNRSGSKSNRGGGSKSNRGYYNGGGGRGRPYQNQTEGFNQNTGTRELGTSTGPNTGYRQRTMTLPVDQSKKTSVNNEDLYNDQ